MPDLFPVLSRPTPATPAVRRLGLRFACWGRVPSQLAGQLRYAGEQTLHVTSIVVVHQSCPDRAASLPDAEHPGEFPGVVVAVPHIDPAAGQVVGHLPRRAAIDGEKS